MPHRNSEEEVRVDKLSEWTGGGGGGGRQWQQEPKAPKVD